MTRTASQRINDLFYWKKQRARLTLFLVWLLSGVGGKVQLSEECCVCDETAMLIFIGGREAGELFFGYCGPGRENQFGFYWGDEFRANNDCGEVLFQSWSVFGMARELRREVME